MSQFIENNWNFSSTALTRYLGEKITIDEFDKTNGEYLSCILGIEKCNTGIKLVFDVSDDDLYMSKQNNFNTMESDGIHLLICATKNYVYLSIFLMPKLDNGILDVVVYNVLDNTIIDKTEIKATIECFNDYYRMYIELTEKFIIKNHMKEYFYLGFVTSNCDRKTKYRKNGLILSKEKEQWFNPLFFSKIYLRYGTNKA